MTNIRLVNIDASHASRYATSPGDLATEWNVQFETATEYLSDVFEQTALLLERLPRAGEWGVFLTVDAATSQVVGTCAYKQAPTPEGLIEIAYYTFPPFESRGYATAMAQELTRRAQASPQVKQVIAHTLPERNASCRALEKAGFQHVGQVIDPEDGSVWRWEYPNSLVRNA